MKGLLVLLHGLWLLLATTAAAATPWVQGGVAMGARSLDPSGLAGDRAFLLSPDLSIGNEVLFLRGSGLLRVSDSQGWQEEGLVEAGFQLSLPGGLGIDLDAGGGTRRYPGLPRSERYRALARLRGTSGRVGGFVGAGGVRARGDALWTTSKLLTAGGSLWLGNFELALDQLSSFSNRNEVSFRDTLILFPDSTLHKVSVPESRRVATAYTDAGFHLAWQRGRWSYAARMGVRFGDFAEDGRVWATVSGGYRLTRILSLALLAGREPSVPEEGIPAGNVASIGLRFGFVPAPTPVPRAAPRYAPPGKVLSARTVAEGEALLSVHLPDASRVEIMGDFTDWVPVDLSRGDDGRWEKVLPLAPGSYRVCLRTDGGPWAAPPGLTEIEDEFNGRVGILVLR